MGLDAWAHVTTDEIDDVDFASPINELDRDTNTIHNEFHYWRNHWSLQDWMTELYLVKDGSDVEFNCARVKLIKDDIDKLEQDINEGNIDYTEMVHFPGDNERVRAEDQKFIKTAREHLSKDKVIYYSAWY